MINQPRAEYPSPQFVRDSWINLNGKWQFEFDDACVGTKQKWHKGDKGFSQTFQVPFAFQSQLSGRGVVIRKPKIPVEIIKVINDRN